MHKQVFVWRSRTFPLVIIKHLLTAYCVPKTEMGVVREEMQEGQDSKALKRYKVKIRYVKHQQNLAQKKNAMEGAEGTSAYGLEMRY